MASPVRVSTDVEQARRAIELVRRVPTPVWGRTSWRPGICGTRTLLFPGSSRERGVETAALRPPAGGRRVQN